jgi:hypothetical protein
VTDGSSQDFKSRWSKDGNLIYFVSTRDGFRCLWAHRLDPTTKQPKGSPFEIYVSHRAQLSLLTCTPMSWSFMLRVTRLCSISAR